jgi:hypothetical protein
MENQIYNWLVKKGNILIQKNGDCVSLQIDYENGEYCLLTQTDTNEIIEILTRISKQIWESPNYERKPYINQLFNTNDNKYYWQIENSKLVLKFNEIENCLEISCIRNKRLNLEINYVVEIIQILEQLNK